MTEHTAENDEIDPWQVHFREAGHSCGQVGGWFYCPTCGWESGTRDCGQRLASPALEAVTECARCDGTGLAWSDIPDAPGFMQSEDCPRCNGLGTVLFSG